MRWRGITWSTPHAFDWRGVDIRYRELEQEIARRAFVGDADIADEMRSDNKVTNSEFLTLFQQARELFPESSTQDVSVSEVLDLLMIDESPLWGLGRDIYKRATG